MRSSPISFAWLGCLISLSALNACGPHSKIIPVEDPSLPTELSEAYKISFRENPNMTADRFLAAYDRFAATGPVTLPRVLDYTRMQEASERGRILGYVLALDLNGDAQITLAEYDRVSTLPKGSNKLFEPEDLANSDENQDYVLSIQEAILYSRKLHARAAAGDMRPIESYLMLFDVNLDGEVTRSEMIARLYTLLPTPQAGRPERKASLRETSPQ